MLNLKSLLFLTLKYLSDIYRHKEVIFKYLVHKKTVLNVAIKGCLFPILKWFKRNDLGSILMQLDQQHLWDDVSYQRKNHFDHKFNSDYPTVFKKSKNQ